MKTIICDLDGTLANINHRLHYLKDQDWDGFFGAVSGDTPNDWCVEILKAMEEMGHEVIFVSGRNESARADTIAWLEKLELDGWELYMRGKNDRRPDHELKAEIYEKHLKDEDILFVLEDRARVAQMWRDRGLVVLQCDVGDF